MTNPIKSPDEPAVRNGRVGRAKGVVFSASETTDLAIRRALRSPSNESPTPADSPGEIRWVQIDLGKDAKDA
jgi:hypothetical protein